VTETVEFYVYFEKQQSFDDGTVQLCIQFVSDWFKGYTGLAIFVIAAYYSTKYFVQLTELVAGIGEW